MSSDNWTTPDLCDAAEQGAIAFAVMEPMFANYGGREQFCGPAVTVKCFEDNSKVKELLATPGRGRVLVVDAGGSLRRACLGDLIAQSAVDNGWAGVVLYGCVRDVDVLATLPLGVQAIGSHPQRTEKLGVGQVDVTVTFAGVSVAPGAMVYADNNGIVVAATALA
jgi:regulator of ribonuclease activity A